MSAQEITDDQFETEVLRSELPVLVEWWATWCGPCRQVAPILERIAEERAGRLRVVRIDQDANPVRSAAHRVMGVPTMILFRDGEPVLQLVGARSKAALEREIDQALAAYAPA